MEYRRLGNSGLQVSVVGLGCNNFGMRIDIDAAQKVVDQALDEGINLFDSADIYGHGQSEEFLGAALKGKRDQAVIATKFSTPMGEGPMRGGTSRRYVMQAVEDSLRRLQTDHIDLYQVHRPEAGTPHEETMRALDDLVRDGKVRYIGNSNYTGWQIAHNHWISRTYGYVPFISAQNEYSLLQRDVEAEVLPASEQFGLGFLPYFPLASGLLTGKYRRNETPSEGRLSSPVGARWLSDSNFDIVERLSEYVEQRGHTLLELAFSWLASKPVVSSVIAGATSPEQVSANVGAASWRLTDEEMAEVSELTWQ